MGSFKEQNQAQSQALTNGAPWFSRALRGVAVLCVLAVLGACASTGQSSSAAHGKRWGAPMAASGGSATPRVANSAGHQKIGRPYQVSGRTYVPARQDNYDRKGVASWYGSKFHGRKTANGEIFDMNQLSAAHTTLPLPSLVRVTNLNNGRTIIVRVNDRGPFVNNRLIDLSRRAAQELGYVKQGITNVRVQYVGPAVSEPARTRVRHASVRRPQANVWPEPSSPSIAPAAGRWFVQVGAFGTRERARQIALSLQASGKVSVQKVVVNNRYLHRVLVGPYSQQYRAERLLNDIANSGYPEARVQKLR